MFDHLRKIFGAETTSQASNRLKEDRSETKKLQIATCAIFLEMAKSDDNCTDEERKEIISIMQRTFDLEKEYTDEYIATSNNERGS